MRLARRVKRLERLRQPGPCAACGGNGRVVVQWGPEAPGLDEGCPECGEIMKIIVMYEARRECTEPDDRRAG